MFPTSESSTSTFYILPPSYNPLIEQPRSGGDIPRRGFAAGSADRCACRERAEPCRDRRDEPASRPASGRSETGGSIEGAPRATKVQQREREGARTRGASGARKGPFAWLRFLCRRSGKRGTGAPTNLKDGSRWGVVPELENPAHRESHHPAAGCDLSQPTKSQTAGEFSNLERS